MVWGFEQLTPEQIAEWQRTLGQTITTPAVKVVTRYKCDSCKQYMSVFNTYLEHAGYNCHLTESCLEKFREKHFQHADFHKSGAAIIIGDGVMVNDRS